jgi:hypothetical protein
VGEGKGSLTEEAVRPSAGAHEAREALDRGDHAAAGRLSDVPEEIRAYLRPDLVAVVLLVVCFLLFASIALYYVALR